MKVCMGLVLVAGAFLSSTIAYAADENFDVYVFTGSTYDDNVYRLPDSAAALVQNGTTKLDDVRTTFGVGGLVNIPVSRQRFVVDAVLRRTQFNRFNELDNTNGRFLGEWRWAYASRATGTLGYSYEQRIADFFELRTRTRDTLTDQSFYGRANIPIHPRWSVVVGADAANISHSERPFLDRDQVTVLGELLFETRGQTFVGLSLQERTGKFDVTENVATVGAVNNDFDETAINAVLRWDATDKSRFSGSLGRTKRDSNNEAGGDFSGTTGNAEYRRIISSKTLIDFELYRRTALIPEIASLVVTRGVAVEPRWKISSRLSFLGRIGYEERDFQGERFVLGGNERSDELLILRAGLSYTLNRALTLDVGLGHQTRSSNVDIADFDQNEISAGIRFRI